MTFRIGGRAALSRRGLLAAGVALPVAAASAGSLAPAAALAQAAPQPHALIDFFRRDDIIAAALSPSGDRVAVLREVQEGDERRALVDIFSATDFSRPLSRSLLGDFEADAMEWASDERLLVSLIQIEAYEARVDSESSTIRDERIHNASRRMVSLDTVNGGAVVLFENRRTQLRYATDLGTVVDMLHDDPEHILMAAWERDGVRGLYRVNVNTGHAELMERGQESTIGWRTENGVPVVRVDVNRRGTFETWYVRSPGDNRWRLLLRRRITETPVFNYLGETGRAGVALVAARRDGEDVISVRELDLTSMTYGPPISSRAGQDVSHALLDDRGQYLGAAYYGDRLQYDLTDATLGAEHRALNGFFENTCNVRFHDVDQGQSRVLVAVDGPREPGAWFLYDRGARNVLPIGSRTALRAERLSPTEALDVPTRDGQTIRAYLTGPLDGRPGPLVAVPHGGPEIRDVMGWDRQAQILAAQGWWVVQPNFRGSGGYGAAFAEAGWRRWGDRMQEDVEDAIAHAIALKGLDASKVAIMGTSYGGYAALMGAVRRPDLYKAAISICGVSDLRETLEVEEREDDTPDNEIYGIWRNRIGDPDSDRDLITAASPRRRAAEIACPVLLVHGENDQIVPVRQSQEMRREMERHGRRVEYVEVRNAGHADWVELVEYGLQQRYIRLLTEAFA